MISDQKTHQAFMTVIEWRMFSSKRIAAQILADAYVQLKIERDMHLASIARGEQKIKLLEAAKDVMQRQILRYVADAKQPIRPHVGRNKK